MQIKCIAAVNTVNSNNTEIMNREVESERESQEVPKRNNSMRVSAPTRTT